jgi:hypothetical protein
MNDLNWVAKMVSMAQFIVHHQHDPSECAASVAAWRGFSSPLRGAGTPSACRFGEHETWWRVTAEDESGAYALLPSFVATRAKVTRVEELKVP